MARRAVFRPRTDQALALLTSRTIQQFNRAALSAALYLVVVAFLAILSGSLDATLADMRHDTLKIITASGEHRFDIEVAESGEDKSRGLMFRQSLADGAGMLFPYQPAQEITMWMKNTYISLDMVFIRADGVVHRVATATEPFSEAVIASGGDVTGVLESRAGIAAKIGLKAGDRVVHPLFRAPAK